MGFEVLQKGEFAAEDFDEEVAVAAGGLKEAAFEPERLVAHEVEHGVHLARIGEHLAMVSHSLAAFDLFCVFVAGHKKSWNFAYAILGVPRPAQQLSKAHDYSRAFTALHCRNLLCGTSRGQLERKRFIICYLLFYSFYCFGIVYSFLV